MITVITPFSRKENIELMANHLKGKCHWVVLIDSDLEFPDWVEVRKYPKYPLPQGMCISNVLFNNFISEGLDDETQYMILCDDDFVEEGFWDKIPNDDVVICSMKRGDIVPKGSYGYRDLIASLDNIGIGKVAGEQLIIKGKILKNYRYGLTNIGDGEMVMKVVAEHSVTYIPDAFVLFNYLEHGRYMSYSTDKQTRTKPVVLFIGDYYCGANRHMGLSEWEGNLWSSLESLGTYDVARFHFDRYFYHTSKRGDEVLLERIKDIQPDFVVLVIYKPPGSDPTVPSLDTIKAINVPVVTVWGDLEASEQRDLAKTLEPYCFKMIGTANESVVSGLGYKYMHVPKDPRIFNNPNYERDLDVVFSGSFGRGRDERREVLQYLIDNGIRLIAGGSEGGDHFTTEDYADRYKRAKIAISFSQARGMNVVNARPFEIMTCGAMLIEQESLELAKLYEEGTDYAVWKTKEDLLEKIRYYLEHEPERYRIANSGHAKTQSLYTARTFWNEVFK